MGFNPFPDKHFFFMCLQYKSFENIVVKGEIACKKQFFPFPPVFCIPSEDLSYSSNLELSSGNSFSMEELKFVIWERVNS